MRVSTCLPTPRASRRQAVVAVHKSTALDGKKQVINHFANQPGTHCSTTR